MARRKRDSLNPAIVLWSTKSSIDSGAISFLAVAEVALSVGLYLAVFEFFQTQHFLWVSVIVAPLLLLRSPESIAKAIEWFEQYIDRSFYDVADLPKSRRGAIRIGASVFLETISTCIAAALLTWWWLPDEGILLQCVVGAAIGYVASQAALTIIVIQAAAEVMVQASERRNAAQVGSLLVVATATGVAISGGNLAAIISASSITVFLAMTGIFQAPPAVAKAMAMAHSHGEARVKGVEFAREALKNAGVAFAVFAPGISLGAWIRIFGIRIVATLLYIREGLAALPSNYYRTLFVVDVAQPPEIIPGYANSDIFNTRYFLNKAWGRESIPKKIVSLVGFFALFFPAYLYRISVKSTFWIYIPIVYIARTPNYSQNPAFFSALLWGDVREWMRRIVFFITVSGFTLSNVFPVIFSTTSVPKFVIAPFEYLFLIRIENIHPWQWLTIIEAALTFVIFLFLSEFSLLVKYGLSDKKLNAEAKKRATMLEFFIRTRNIATWIFLIIVVAHAILLTTPIERYLPRHLDNALHEFYGESMPLRTW